MAVCFFSDGDLRFVIGNEIPSLGTASGETMRQDQSGQWTTDKRQVHLQLSFDSRKDLQEELVAPAAHSSLHDDAGFRGLLFQEG